MGVPCTSNLVMEEILHHTEKLPSFTMGFIHLQLVQDFVQRSQFYGLFLLMIYDTTLYYLAFLCSKEVFQPIGDWLFMLVEFSLDIICHMRMS